MANKIKFTGTRSFLKKEGKSYFLLSKHIGEIKSPTCPVKKILISTKFVYLCSLFEAFTHQAMEEYYTYLKNNPTITRDKIKFGKILRLVHEHKYSDDIIKALKPNQWSLEEVNILNYVSLLVERNLYTGKTLDELYKGKLFEKYTLIGGKFLN